MSQEDVEDRGEAPGAAGLSPEPARPQNTEVVRRFLELVNEDRIDLALELVEPGAELDWSGSQAPDSGVYRGPEGWGGFWTGRSGEITDARWEIAELVEVPPDRVLIVAYMRGRGRASGAEISGLGAAVCTLREGRMTKLTMYQSREEALAAQGRDAPLG